MSTDNNEDRSPDDPMAGLPEGERAETQAILDELQGEAPAPEAGDGKKEGTEGPDGKKPEEEKKPEGKAPNDRKKPEGESGKQEEKRREVKLMPAWVHEAAKADMQKQIDALTKDLEAARNDPNARKEGAGEGDRSGATDEDLEKEAEAFAEKHNLMPELAKDLLSYARKGQGSLTSELVEKLAKVDKLQAESEIAAEVAQYTADFDRLILPLVKAEYGDDVPSEVVNDIREELKELAYNPDFAKVPYATLYKGEDKFRDRIPPEKRGAEPSRGGSTAQAGETEGEKPDLTKPLTDAQIKALSETELDEYLANMDKRK